MLYIRRFASSPTEYLNISVKRDSKTSYLLTQCPALARTPSYYLHNLWHKVGYSCSEARLVWTWTSQKIYISTNIDCMWSSFCIGVWQCNVFVDTWMLYLPQVIHYCLIQPYIKYNILVWHHLFLKEMSLVPYKVIQVWPLIEGCSSK